jgi:low temperature requirement protein LtrA
MLFGLMLAGLLLSTSIPKAFEGRGLTFAAAYSAMQVGRTLFFLWSVPAAAVGQRNNFVRILIWLVASAVFWVAGGLAEGNIRVGLWLVALAIEYAGPAMRFRTPRLGASTTQDWEVEGGHMAERCALFIIIALGESVVVTGATFAETAWTATTAGAFVVALVGSIAMWWVYFHLGAEAGSEHISQSSDSGRLARLAYTYLHLPVVAGIIVSAVGDELLLAHPTGHVGAKETLSIVGGPLLYLIGTILFKHAIRGIFQLSHLVGIGLFVALLPFASRFTPLSLAAVAAVVLIIVAAWEAVSLGSDSRQGAA